jgi:NADH-quinone oxidoreductase subunit A
MLAEYTGVLILLVIALVVAGVMLLAQQLLSPSRSFHEKQEPFECGESQIVSPHQRFSVKFYLVAMLFLVFDLEAVFFYPWGALFTDLGWYGYVIMSVFTVPLVVGLAYEWMKGALEW